MIVKAVSIKEIDFSPYGTYFDMLNDGEKVYFGKGDVWKDYLTKSPLIDTGAHLGITKTASVPFVVDKMERHLYTEEALFCLNKPIVLTLAKNTGEDFPRSENITAVILELGDVVSLKRGVWHDACRSLEGEAYYYYIASIPENDAHWIEVEGDLPTIDI